MHKRPIRLSSQEVHVITESFRIHFGKDDHLWLFGSRTDPSRRGGDIDLYVETLENDTKRALHNKRAFISALWMQLGEQKIDVVLHLLSHKQNLPIYEVARNEGVKLI